MQFDVDGFADVLSGLITAAAAAAVTGSLWFLGKAHLLHGEGLLNFEAQQPPGAALALLFAIPLFVLFGGAIVSCVAELIHSIRRSERWDDFWSWRQLWPIAAVVGGVAAIYLRSVTGLSAFTEMAGVIWSGETAEFAARWVSRAIYAPAYLSVLVGTWGSVVRRFFDR